MQRSGGLPPAPAPAPARGGSRTILIAAGAAVAVVAVAILIGIIARGGNEDNGASAGATTTDGTPIALLTGDALNAARIKGQATAPVTIIEYADLQCPNCASFSRQTEPEIVKRYVDTGKAKLEYRHFPFLGKESTKAAEATECANEQGRFWAYRDKLYASQSGENRGAFSDDNLKKFAQGLGLDMNAFNACFDGGKFSDRVKKDFQDGKMAGVQGTPTFYVNGTQIVGAQPLPAFTAVIDQALQAAGVGR